ncbi:MAG: hypothetical protein ISS79_06660 [Phycisphaerae bacterium]|nr:hypothetical protein [Phycisphaerae bacterium]
MQPLFETLAVTILAFLGLFLGLLLGQIRKRWWALGYAFPLVSTVAVGLARLVSRLRFLIPFSWISAGRNEFVVLAFVVPMALGTLIWRLPKKSEKILAGLLLVVASVLIFIYPFLVPVLIRSKLEQLSTCMTSSGLCLQNTSYTCGPAAAVTALARLGIKAEEGELAVLARTTPQMGTPDDTLALAIEQRYGTRGLRCTYRHFDSIAQLKGMCPTIAVVKFAFLVDHYITVLEVSDDKVVVADPIVGKEELTYEQFGDKWRYIGIVVQRSDR